MICTAILKSWLGAFKHDDPYISCRYIWNWHMILRHVSQKTAKPLICSNLIRAQLTTTVVPRVLSRIRQTFSTSAFA